VLFYARYKIDCFLPIHIYDLSGSKPIVVFLGGGRELRKKVSWGKNT